MGIKPTHTLTERRIAMNAVGVGVLTVEQKAAIPYRVGNGETQESIAREHGIAQSSVSYHASKDESKAIIEREARKLLAFLPEITEQTKSELITSATLQQYIKGETDKNPTRLETNADILAYQKLMHKKQDRIQAMAGIMPSNVQSIAITNIYNDNRSAVLTPAVAEALGIAVAGSLSDGEIIDVEPVGQGADGQ